MKRCPSCQAENLDDAVFCDNCGASLGAPTPTPPQPVVAPPPPAPAVQQPPQPAPAPVPLAGAPAGNKCAACGTLNELGSLFCENCGASLTAAKPVAPPPPAPSPVMPPATPPPPAPAPVTPPAVPTPPSPTPSAATPQPVAPAPAAPSVIPPPALPVPVVPPQPAAPSALGMIVATPATQPPPPGHPRFVVAASGMYFDISARAELMIGRVDPISGIFPEIDLTAHGGDEGGVSRKHCKITLAGNQFFAEDQGSSNGTWVGTTRLQPSVRAELNNGDQLRLGKVVLNFFTGV